MSCSIEALPILLLYAIGVFKAKSAANNIRKQILDNPELFAEGAEKVTDSIFDNLIEKEFETPFTDKEVLLKTMEEHGITDIEESYDGKITGKLNAFGFMFEKPSEGLSYHLKITCNQKDNAEEKMNDIASEYALNVQEAAYLSIVEKLKENNMEIESEEVEDDNTIVLTVNLE